MKIGLLEFVKNVKKLFFEGFLLLHFWSLQVYFIATKILVEQDPVFSSSLSQCNRCFEVRINICTAKGIFRFCILNMKHLVEKVVQYKL